MLRAFSIALLSCSFSCASHEIQNEPVPVQSPSVATRWQAVEPAGRSAWLDAPARVVSSPNDTALVTVPLAARVLRVRVHPGQQVREGEPLVDVVMPELIRAAGALRSAELRLASWQERRNIVAPLLEKGLARAVELSEIDANIASVRGDRESARATLRAAGEADGRAGSLLDGNGTVALRAPITGVVVNVATKVGEVREPNSGPLFELISVDADPRIEAQFSATPPVGATFEWVGATLTIPLVLETLSPHADERNGSRTGWLIASESRAALVAGSLGKVRMVVREDWVVIPAAAIEIANATTVVESKTADGVRKVPVQVIQQSRTEALVSGLPADAMIAADVQRERAL